MHFAYFMEYGQGMENEIIKKILKLEKEQKVRLCDELNQYNKDKVHLKQLAFHNSYEIPSVRLGTPL